MRKVSVALSRLLPEPQGKRLGVAVSGGPDSVALCDALVQLAPARGIQLTVLHVNHRLRPQADAEQQLVEQLCRRWQLPCLVEVLSPPERHSGIEAWARQERYRFFQRVRDDHGLDAVAVAHTLDDQAETVLFRLLRGAARRGLAGMPATRGGWLIRPLLDCSRQEVMAYLGTRQLPYTVDPSNADLRYTRNKIRHLLLPFLAREFTPRICSHLANLAKVMRDEEDWLEAQARAAYMRVVAPSQVLSLVCLQAEPAALRMRILRHWLEQNGQTGELGFVHLEAVARLSAPGGRGQVTLPRGVSVQRVGNTLRIAPPARIETLSPYCCVLTPGQEVVLPQAGWRVMVSPLQPWNDPPHSARSADRWQAIFDGACLGQGFFVRPMQPGDRIRPLGMQGHRKVHDVFIDAKIPRHHRQAFPLILIGQEIAWVPGCVRGETARITAATRCICRVTVNPLPEKGKLC
ncbi:MAG: tRNA lysidine(34) synthetase TilS [Candidatus Binatia bacterium]|nr:tRNA lysidine(34) synthetase TilS [Candidatus Binatia bacterium]